MKARVGKTLSVVGTKISVFLPTIPVDPAGDYCYQDTTKPCEVTAARQTALLSNT